MNDSIFLEDLDDAELIDLYNERYRTYMYYATAEGNAYGDEADARAIATEAWHSVKFEAEQRGLV